MKKPIRDSIVVVTSLMIVVLAGCSGAGAGSTGSSGGSGTSSMNKSAKLYDANSDFIGYVTDSNAITVSVYTTSGYFVTLSWAGTLTNGVVYFTGTNATGTPFFQYVSASPLSGGFTQVINEQPYVPASLDANDNAATDPSITSYQSVDNQGTITNESSPVSLFSGYVATPLVIATLTQIGLPSTLPLPLPLKIEFQ